MKKKIIVAAGVLAVLAVVVIGLLYSSVPSYNESLMVKGLKAPVEVTRNRWAVPSIKAQNEEDLYFAWGYVNAQDRMFQMEVTRRAGYGRLSEFAGEQALSKDIFLRAVGFSDIAKQATDALPPRIKQLYQRYADGINFYLENHTPLYFRLVGLKKEKWTVGDLPLVGMLLNWSMSYNWKEEVLFYRVARKIGLERSRMLFRTAPPKAGTIVEGIALNDRAVDRAAAVLADVEKTLGTCAASNNWVIAPARTSSGGAILSNDPHVHSSKIPNDWYLVRLKAGGFEAAGAQVAGFPGIVLGYNRHIAWGITNNAGDVIDLFIEKVDLRKGTYVFRGRERKLRARTEIFLVKKKGPVTKTIYYAGRRPLIGEALDIQGAAVSLYWTVYDRLGIEGFHYLNRARDYREFRDAASRIGIAPQNMVYADAGGNIAYVLTGFIPRRLRGTGTVISAGDRVDRNWDGYLDFSENPSVLNPARGFIATANNLVSKNMPEMNGTYHPSYRYERIDRMLSRKERMGVKEVAAMHLDNKTLLRDKVVGLMNRYVDAKRDGRIPKALEIVNRWDGTVSKEKAAPSIYNTFLARFIFNTFADELGPELAAQYAGNHRLSLDRFFELAGENSAFFDDVTTPERETLSDAATKSLIDALDILRRHCGGDDMEAWAWGKVHVIKYDHVLGASAFFRPFVNLGPSPYDGDCETVGNAFYTEVEPPYITDLTAGVRMVVCLGPSPRGYLMLMTGENEHFMSGHYRDMTDAMRAGRLFCVEDEKPEYTAVLSPE